MPPSTCSVALARSKNNMHRYDLRHFYWLEPGEPSLQADVHSALAHRYVRTASESRRSCADTQLTPRRKCMLFRALFSAPASCFMKRLMIPLRCVFLCGQAVWWLTVGTQAEQVLRASSALQALQYAIDTSAHRVMAGESLRTISQERAGAEPVIDDEQDLEPDEYASSDDADDAAYCMQPAA